MSSVNKVILIGRLGKDPETRYMQDGGAITSWSMATSERYKDKSGEQQEKTEWHRCVSFGKVAELVAEYVQKGALIYVEGKLQTRKWQDKDGVDKYTTEVVVFAVQFLQRANGGERSSEERPAAQKQERGAPAQQKSGGSKFDDFEDDIPF